MHHDNVLKKVEFGPLIPRVRGVCGLNICFQVGCCICDSIYFDMQHDRVLKKLNFDLLTPSPGSLWVCGQNLMAFLNYSQLYIFKTCEFSRKK